VIAVADPRLPAIEAIEGRGPDGVTGLLVGLSSRFAGNGRRRDPR